MRKSLWLALVTALATLPAHAEPFSWGPEAVEVAESGTLAHSSGPVKDAAGKQMGVYNSIWRREKDGRWRVVFDKPCDCAIACATSKP